MARLKAAPQADQAGLGAGQYVSVDRAEELTSISAWTWRKWCYTRRVASTKPGRRLLIPYGEIQRIMQEGYRAAESRQQQGK